MLLENKSKVNFSITIDLKFDDDSEKKIDIKIGDIIKVHYSQNGNKLVDTGKIVDIVPVMQFKNHNPLKEKQKVTAKITLDCSTEDFRSKVITINMMSILDIELIRPEIEIPIEPEKPCHPHHPHHPHCPNKPDCPSKPEQDNTEEESTGITVLRIVETDDEEEVTE